MTKSDKTWVVVANSSCVRIFQLGPAHILTEVETLIHPASRLKDSDLVSSGLGRSFESSPVAHHARHAMEPPTSPKEVEFQSFARILCEFLQNAYRKGGYKQFYLVANPSFLGLVRQYLPNSLHALIKKEVSKDMTHMKPNEIMEHILSL